MFSTRSAVINIVNNSQSVDTYDLYINLFVLPQENAISPTPATVVGYTIPSQSLTGLLRTIATTHQAVSENTETTFQYSRM